MGACKSCRATLGARNQSGYCRKCFSRSVPVSDETRAKISAGIKRKLMEDPEFAEQRKEHARQASRSPAAVEARTERWNRERLWEKGTAARCKPEVAKRAGRPLSARRLAWCPPHLRQAYRDLINVKRIKAAEARRMILEQDAAEVAAVRQRMNYQEPERGPIGRPAVWPDCPEKLRPEYERLRRKGVLAVDARRLLEKVA